MNKIYFLGPQGTFTYDAARTYFPDDVEDAFVPCATPPDVIRKVSQDEGVFGVVPIENSVHGEVIPTLDALIFEFDGIFVVGEVSLPITFNYFSVGPEVSPSIAVSHPHALAQCRRFISRHGLTERTSSSTADACRAVAEAADPTLGAIAAPGAGKRYGLYSKAEKIEDYPGAHTRFLVLAAALANPKPGAEKSMLAIVPTRSTVGTLAEMTSVFASRHINIFSVHSRPVRSAVGEYVFTLNVAGNALEGTTRSAIEELLGLGYLVKLLGTYAYTAESYPAAPFNRIPGLVDGGGYAQLRQAGVSARE